MAPKNPGPVILPYRDTNNTDIKYASSGTNGATTTTSNAYDSDYEPLIEDPTKNFTGGLSDHDLQHFTATGRPAPQFKASALMNLGAGDSFTMPQYLPKRYTDDSIIPAIVTNIIPSPKAAASPEIGKDGAKKKGFLSMFKGDKKQEKNGGLIKMKVVYMPRRDYLKHFARDEKGVYIGSEPAKQWNEDELEELFGKYTPKPEERKGYRIPT